MLVCANNDTNILALQVSCWAFGAFAVFMSAFTSEWKSKRLEFQPRVTREAPGASRGQSAALLTQGGQGCSEGGRLGSCLAGRPPDSHMKMLKNKLVVGLDY